MTLIETFQVGSLRCHALNAGSQQLDGGAMFGVVPKPLWSRRIEADERNRIRLALRCLLIEHPAGLVLVDTGLGNKEDEKFRDIYGVENAGESGRTRLEDALSEAGHEAERIKWVVNTHLHFDHAGGNTTAQEPGAQPVPSFPGAAHVVQAGELDFAERPNERTSGSYLAHNYRPISEAGLWEPVRGRTEILPGVTLLPTPGHVPHHQSVMVSDGGETALFLADLVPTAHHLPLPWIMGYDLEPLVTLETKRLVLSRAEAEGWLLVFGHDMDRALGRVGRDGKSYIYMEA